MTPTPTLPGSRIDSAPLLQCVLCLRKREQAGGIVNGVRFICRDCVMKRMRRG